MRTNVLKSAFLIVITPALALLARQPVSAAEKEIVSYRLSEWKTLHFDDADLATKHLDTMKMLGCQVKQDSHGGHIDVSYYCPQWKQATVATHSVAHKWEKWLRGAGFETRHTH